MRARHPYPPSRGLREDETRWRPGLQGCMQTLVTQRSDRDLSANQNARALITMMARSTTRSNLRPDTLMQDRLPPDRLTSCNARSDHAFGSN